MEQSPSKTTLTNWPHSPKHLLSEKGVYMVTAATYQKVKYFNDSDRLDFLQHTLLTLAVSYGWQLQAWAVLSNHYHFVAQSPDNPNSLRDFISQLHVTTASQINKLDTTPNRRVWWQYWDSRITFQYSYMARLNYVKINPVKHGLVADARAYSWCSANWFDKTAPKAFVKAVDSLKTDKVNILDDF